VGLIVLSLVFFMAVVLGALLAKGILTLVLHLIVDRELPIRIPLRTATFLGALIAFWLLGPAVVASPAASGLIALLR